MTSPGQAHQPARPAATKRPNILFMVADDQRFDTIAALGNPHIRTPNLDGLVRQGAAFTHAFIMGSTVGAVCICSRSMLLTGRHLFHSPNQPPGELPLWPETFRQAGYTTHGIGKWHNGPASYARCFDGGADIFFGGMSNHLQVPVHDFDPSGQYPEAARRTAKQFSSEMFSDAAVRFLKEYRDDRPFFLYVAYTAPHDPRMAPKAYADLYPPKDAPLPENFLPEHPFDNGEMTIRDEKLAPWPRTPEEVRRHVAAYYAMISHMDAQIGRVLQALNDSGRAGNTIIVFASDHGLAVGQHGLMGKQNLYDHSVRVPLLMAGPGVPRGRTIDALCYLHDVFPTACELAGVPAPATIESASLAPLLAGRERQERGSVFGAYRDVQRMVRDERHKLIRYPKIGRTQLFDLRADPWEKSDLSADPRHAETIRGLAAELKQWQKRAGDVLDLGA